MIKNMLTRRKDSDTYLATVCRHRWSRQITIKVDVLGVFQPTSTADESQCWLKAPNKGWTKRLFTFQTRIKIKYLHKIKTVYLL